MRAELKHDGTYHGYGHSQHHRTDKRADQRTEQNRAERPASFAASRHRISVEHGCRRRCLAGNTEQNGCDVASRRGDGVHAEKEREGGDGVHRVHERQHHGERRRAAKARQDSHQKAYRDADEHDAERVGRQHLPQCRKEHVHG